MKIELTVQQDYVSNWGLFEAIRELIQNGIDAETDGYDLGVEYNESSSRLTVVTEGVVLTPKTLLLGYSGKRDRSEMIGQYGEGYKLALLTLIKRGCDVTISTGDSKWTPYVAKSKKFEGEKVLFIDIKGGLKYRNRTKIDVYSLSKEDWKEIKPKFLRFDDNVDDHSYLGGTKILTDERYKGCIFVGGIFVEKNKTLSYGYNFHPSKVRLDRDRAMINSWDLQELTAAAWKSASEEDPELVLLINKLIREGSQDVQGMKYSWNSTDRIRHYISKKFLEDFGEKAVPVLQADHVEKASFYGRRGVVVGEAMLEMIKDSCDTLEAIKEQMKDAVEQQLDITELEDQECTNLLRALSAVSLASSLDLSQIRVVEFKEKDIFGSCGGGIISLSRNILSDFEKVLPTLVHEVAHLKTGASDGDPMHILEIENIWFSIVNSLLKKRESKAKVSPSKTFDSNEEMSF